MRRDRLRVVHRFARQPVEPRRARIRIAGIACRLPPPLGRYDPEDIRLSRHRLHPRLPPPTNPHLAAALGEGGWVVRPATAKAGRLVPGGQPRDKLGALSLPKRQPASGILRILGCRAMKRSGHKKHKTAQRRPGPSISPRAAFTGGCSRRKISYAKNRRLKASILSALLPVRAETKILITSQANSTVGQKHETEHGHLPSLASRRMYGVWRYLHQEEQPEVYASVGAQFLVRLECLCFGVARR